MDTLNTPHMPPNQAIPPLRRPDKLADWGAPSVAWLPMSLWQDGTTPLSKVLFHFGSGIQQLNFVGGWDAEHTPSRAWWDEPTRHGIRMSRVTKDPAGARYTIANHHIDVRMSAAWYGECADVDAIRAAHKQLAGLISGTFGYGAHLWGTPGRTGIDLFERNLPAGGAEYPAIPVKLEEVIRHNIGQGRMEFCAPDGLTVVDELINLDARWMYAACIANLPRGPIQHLSGAAARSQGFMKYKHAWYRVVFRVPEKWAYVGILPAWNAETEKAYFPRRNTGPACWYETIVAEPELRVALDNGWEVKILESWFHNFWGEQIPDPARNWIEKLRNLRERQSNKLIAGALRNIANHTVGQWHRTAQRQLNKTPASEHALIPYYAEDIQPVPSLANVEHFEWYAPAKLHPDQLKYQHPEWSGYVWSRARSRVVQAALSYQKETPGGDVIAFRNDAIVVTADPHWPATGPVGSFREKRRWLRGIALPDGSIWDGTVPRDELHYRQLLGVDESAQGEGADDGE